MLEKEIVANMKKIVDNCMGEELAGCVTSCPMHTDVRKYIGLIKLNKGEEVILQILKK